MPLTRSAARAARSHRALASDDVLSAVFSFITPEAGFGAATACKTLRDAWRRRCRGMLRVHRQIEGSFRDSDQCVAYGDGVMFADYGGFDESSSLGTFSADGTLLSRLNTSPDGQTAVALRGDGTAWVITYDDEVVCVRLAELPSGGESEVLMGIDHINTDGECFPESLALAGDTLLVLCRYLFYDESVRRSTYLNVYDNQTGAFLRKFLLPGQDGNVENAGTMTVQGDMLYVTSQNNGTVDEYRWSDGTLMRSFGGGERHLSFRDPLGIAVRGKTMYVSERRGRRIQVLRLPDDDSAEPEILQVIPSPDDELGGLCVNGDRLWCMGRKYPRIGREKVHLFGPCYE